MSQFDESTFPPRMIQMVMEDPNFVRDQIIMRSPFHKRKLIFVSHNTQYMPSCGECWNGLYLDHIPGYIKGHITVGTCNKCRGLQYQVVYLSAEGSVITKP